MIKSEIQFIRSLGEKQSRNEYGLFIAEGEKFIRELIDSPIRVRKVYLRDDAEIEFDPSVEVEYVSDKEMERISQLKSANNSLALVEMPRYSLDTNVLEGRLTIALDGVHPSSKASPWVICTPWKTYPAVKSGGHSTAF